MQPRSKALAVTYRGDETNISENELQAFFRDDRSSLCARLFEGLLVIIYQRAGHAWGQVVKDIAHEFITLTHT